MLAIVIARNTGRPVWWKQSLWGTLAVFSCFCFVSPHRATSVLWMQSLGWFNDFPYKKYYRLRLLQQTFWYWQGYFEVCVISLGLLLYYTETKCVSISWLGDFRDNSTSIFHLLKGVNRFCASYPYTFQFIFVFDFEHSLFNSIVAFCIIHSAQWGSERWCWLATLSEAHRELFRFVVFVVLCVYFADIVVGDGVGGSFTRKWFDAALQICCNDSNSRIYTRRETYESRSFTTIFRGCYFNSPHLPVCRLHCRFVMTEFPVKFYMWLIRMLMLIAMKHVRPAGEMADEYEDKFNE